MSSQVPVFDKNGVLYALHVNRVKCIVLFWCRNLQSPPQV